MTKDEVISFLEIERECISRDCDRNCGECDLVQDRDTLLKAYDLAIADLKQQAHPTGYYTLARAMDELMKTENEVKEDE